MIRYKALLTFFAASCCLLLGTSANADRYRNYEREIVEVDLNGIGPGEGAYGEVEILSRENGPDSAVLTIRDLPPRSRISVFLTRFQEPGRLPAQFVGEFRTNKHGKGRLRLRTEIINAFASANQALEDENGEADVMAGLLVEAGGTANTIPLNWFRGYFVPEDGGNVFGTSEDVAGGPIAFISEPELP